MAIPPPQRAARVRQPSRKKPTASISLRWETYDKLDQMALDSNLSISMVIESLVEMYAQQTTAKKAEASP